MRLFGWIWRLIGRMYATILMFFVNRVLWIISKLMYSAVVAKDLDQGPRRLTRLYEVCIANAHSTNHGFTRGMDIYNEHPEIEKLHNYIYSRQKAMQETGKIGYVKRHVVKSAKQQREEDAADMKIFEDLCNSIDKNMKDKELKFDTTIKQNIVSEQLAKEFTEEINTDKQKAKALDSDPETVKMAADSIRQIEDERILNELESIAKKQPKQKSSKKLHHNGSKRRTSKTRPGLRVRGSKSTKASKKRK